MSTINKIALVDTCSTLTKKKKKILVPQYNQIKKRLKCKNKERA